VVGLAARLRDPALFVDAAHVNQKGMAQKAQGVYEALLPLVSGVIAGRAQEQSPEPVTRSRPPTP
jgi:hypothetical protein